MNNDSQIQSAARNGKRGVSTAAGGPPIPPPPAQSPIWNPARERPAGGEEPDRPRPAPPEVPEGPPEPSPKAPEPERAG
jgi:hypothetical protein